MKIRKKIIIFRIWHFILIIFLWLLWKKFFFNNLNTENRIINNIWILYIYINILILLLLIPYWLILSIKEQITSFLTQRHLFTAIKLIGTILMSTITIIIIFGVFYMESKKFIIDIIEWPLKASQTFKYIYIQKEYSWDKYINEKLTLLIESLSEHPSYKFRQYRIKLYLRTNNQERLISKKKYKEIYSKYESKQISSWSKISFKYLPWTQVILSDTIK